MADAKTFSILEAAQGRSYPTETYPIYLDHDAAYHIAQLEKAIGDEKDSERADELTAQRAALVEQVKASAVKITLKGLSTEARESVEALADAKFGIEVESEDKIDWRNKAFLAAHIAKVEDATGAVDSTVWDGDNIGDLLRAIPEEEIVKLYKGMADVTFQAAYFDHIEVTPDF